MEEVYRARCEGGVMEFPLSLDTFTVGSSSSFVV
jgi:hypothetical protein